MSIKGDSEEYSADLTLDKNYGKVGLVGYAEVEVIDSNGESVNKIITPFTSTTHPATVNIYTIEQSELFGVLLMIVAFPLTLISIIFGMIAIPLVFKRHRFSSYLLLSAGIIGALALIFYINGLFTLVNLLDSSVKETLDTGVIGEGFNLNYGVLLIPITTVIMFFIGSVLAFLNRIPKAEAKAIAERKKLEAAGVPIPHPPPDFEPSSGEEPITFRVLDDAETKNAVQPQPSKKHKHKGRKRKGSKEKSKVNND